jgi:hypothetical protein
MNARPVARTTAVLVLLTALGACADDREPTGAAPGTSATPAPTPASTTPAVEPPATPKPLPDGVVDPVALTQGAPLAVDGVVDGTIYLDGRTIESDLPEGAAVRIMGAVDDLVVVSGLLPGDYPTRYWSVDASGRSRPLGDGGYESYNDPPFLVEETGHVWVNYSDRGTGGSTIWELDVRTGEELLELGNGDEPPPLEPADQAVLDVYRNGAPYPQEPSVATSPDGTLVATTVRRAGRDELVVRRAGDDVLRLGFARGDELSDLDARLDLCNAPRRRCRVAVRAGLPVWEDDGHVLVPFYLTTADRRFLEADVTQVVVVRCDLEGACESATGVVDSAALGVHPTG